MSVLLHERPPKGHGPAPLKVLLADDHPLILAGIRRTLEDADGIEIVGEARSCQELLALVERRRPDLVLMDLRMPDANGTEHIEKIRASWPQVKVVILSACDDRPSVEGALRAGANAYVIKSVQPIDIASVLRQTSGLGTVFYAPSGDAAVVGKIAPDEEPVPSILTERERDVLAALAAGKTTAQISQELWLSEHTVKYHLTNIYRKLEVGNRAAAVRRAFEQGLVTPTPRVGAAA